MCPHLDSTPPGKEKAAPLEREHGKAGELQGTLPTDGIRSSSPLAIARKRRQHHACRLWQLWIKSGNRRHFVAFRRHVDAMAANQNGGRP